MVFRGVKFPGRSCEGRAGGREAAVMSRIYERTVMSLTAFDNRDIISCVSCLMRAYTDDSMIDVATGKRIVDSTFYMPGTADQVNGFVSPHVPIYQLTSDPLKPPLLLKQIGTTSGKENECHDVA